MEGIYRNLCLARAKLTQFKWWALPWNMRKAVRESIDTRVPPWLPCANVRIRVHMASFLSHDMIALLGSFDMLMPSWVLIGDR